MNPSLLAFAGLATALGLYLLGLFGGFLFDDYPNIVDNDSLLMARLEFASLWEAAFSSGSGMLRRPVSMLSFAINAAISGMDPVVFKLTNIGIHLVNGGLVYGLCLHLIPRLRADQAGSVAVNRAIAIVVASLWLLHPLHVSSVLYVVQRMNLLASLFLLAGLIFYCRARTAQLGGSTLSIGNLAGVLLFGGLATYSKENGLLLSLYCLVIEVCCFRFAAAHPVLDRMLKPGLLGGATVGALGLLAYLLTHPEFLSEGYILRDFTLTERLLTQCRVLLHYLAWTLYPDPSLLALYHDDIEVSRSLVSPWTTLPAVVFIGLMAILAVLLRARAPWASFASLWFLAGHAMESTFLPLEMVFEHRQYLPMVGLILGLGLGVTASLGARRAALLASLLAVGLGGALGYRSWLWNEPLRLAQWSATHHPASARAQYDVGRILLDRAQDPAERAEQLALIRSYLTRSMALSPGYLHPAAALVLSYQQTEAPPATALAELERRIREVTVASPLPLMQVIKAVSLNSLSISPAQMERLLQASLANRHLPVGGHALILTHYGHYVWKTTANREEAHQAVEAAISLQPTNPLFHVNAALLAQQTKDPTLAQHLENAKRLDRSGVYEKQIRQIEQGSLGAPRG